MKRIPLDTNGIQERIDAIWKRARKDPEIREMALAAKVGGRIRPEALKGTPLKTFLLANHLHHAMQAVRLALPEDGALPLDTGRGTEWVRLQDLRVQKEGNTKTFSTPTGRIAFKTDLKDKLTSDYSFSQAGIRAYNQWRSPGLIPYMRDDSAKWGHQCLLEIMTETHHSQGDDGVGGWSGQHSYVILRHRDGRCYAFGKYGPFDDVQFVDKISPGGKKEGRISSLDEYAFHPSDHSNSHSAKVVLTEAEFDAILAGVEADRQNPGAFSLMNENCNTYVTSLIKHHLNIEVQNKMPLRTYFLRLAPCGLRHAVSCIHKSLYLKLPLVGQKLILALLWPFRYGLDVGCTFVGYLLSRFNRGNLKGSDITLLDVALGRGTIDHPVAFRESITPLLDDQGFLKRPQH